MSFTIRELESLSGIKAHTIRIWEQRYRFLKPSRTVTNIRTYSNDELKTLLTVALLNKYGYRISRIDQMDQMQRNQALLSISDRDAVQEKLVNEMIGHMIDLRPQFLEELLDQHIREHGMETTITTLVFQFLEKVGLLWQTNRILPVQEHIVSNVIRQKLITGIDGLQYTKKREENFLLFLPEDEHHEMGLLFVYYLLKKQNFPVLYLGANVPLKDVEYLLKLRNPEYLYIHLTSFPRQHAFQKYVHQLNEKVSSSKVLISGSIPPPKGEFANIQFMQSLTDVVSYLSKI